LLKVVFNTVTLVNVSIICMISYCVCRSLSC
jgi:hypothetical protein